MLAIDSKLRIVRHERPQTCLFARAFVAELRQSVSGAPAVDRVCVAEQHLSALASVVDDDADDYPSVTDDDDFDWLTHCSPSSLEFMCSLSRSRPRTERVTAIEAAGLLPSALFGCALAVFSQVLNRVDWIDSELHC